MGLVVAVAAYAKAEADPGFAYSIGHVPLTYAHAPVAYGAPLVYAAPAAGCQNSEGKFVPCAQGSYFRYVPIAAAAAPAEEAPAVESERKKREAEPAPEADPEAAAEADPEADPWLYYSGLYGHGYGYGGYHYAPLTDNYAPYTYAAYHHPLTYFYGGCRNNQGALVPCAGR